MNDKIFDEWNELVDCNECQKYWLDQCDGVPIDDARRCNSYVAVRSSEIPKVIDELQFQTKIHELLILLLAVSFLIHFFI